MTMTASLWSLILSLRSTRPQELKTPTQAMKMPKNAKSMKSQGPNPEHVKIEGDWETAVGKALEKEQPKEGWPHTAIRKKP